MLKLETTQKGIEQRIALRNFNHQSSPATNPSYEMIQTILRYSTGAIIIVFAIFGAIWIIVDKKISEKDKRRRWMGVILTLLFGLIKLFQVYNGK